MDFTDVDYQDFTYELNDGEITNDVLCIVGEADLEELVRGYDTGSIAKYGRRSFKIDRPIVANVASDEAEAIAQATEVLDRNIEPYAFVQIVIMNMTSTLTTGILGLEISELCHVTETTCGLSAVHFIVESIELSIDLKGYITATIGLVQARAGEY
jgi:hypothetical protein